MVGVVLVLSSLSSFSPCSASVGQSGGLEEGCGGLQKVLHVVVPQLFLQRCSMGPLLPSGFSEEGTEL